MVPIGRSVEVSKQSEHQQQVLFRLKEQPLVARKSMQCKDGEWLGLKPWRFEKGARETILCATVNVLKKQNLVREFDCGDRLEIRLVR